MISIKRILKHSKLSLALLLLHHVVIGCIIINLIIIIRRVTVDRRLRTQAKKDTRSCPISFAAFEIRCTMAQNAGK